jgi:hypothetical protein
MANETPFHPILDDVGIDTQAAGWNFALLVARVRNQIHYEISTDVTADMLLAEGFTPEAAYLIYTAAYMLVKPKQSFS